MGTDIHSQTTVKDRILSRLAFLYDQNQASACLKKLTDIANKYGFTLQKKSTDEPRWDHKDAILITYGDVISIKNEPQKPRLKVLEEFVDRHLKEHISTVHILPFFPSSSDAGFSVIDHKKVREDLGSWDDIQRFGSKYKLMADLVINHASRFGIWFENYEQGKVPGKDYFIEVDKDKDFSEVTRPRSSPLLTTVQTERGLRHVWTTFSDDQIDLDFTNPDVLLEFIDIFLFYISKGIKIIRLDAIAYVWKKAASKSIHLPQTHQIVKLFRDLADCIEGNITLITETNVPFDENISYFGEGDEAHMVYQFSLPPLLLHAILIEDASYLIDWAASLPELPKGCTFFNFTASHDGIGVRPLEGLVPPRDVDYLAESTKDKGGFVSYKSNSDGGKNPYELNITYFDAFEEPGHPRTDIQVKRFMCSQIIMLSLKGVPGIYFHNFTATKNNWEGVLESGTKRDINRKQWDWDDLNNRLQGKGRTSRRVFNKFKELLKERKAHPAFHPAGAQQVIRLHKNLFSFIRTAPGGQEKIFVISNVSCKEIVVGDAALGEIKIPPEGWTDQLSGDTMGREGTLKIKPLQTVWLGLVPHPNA